MFVDVIVGRWLVPDEPGPRGNESQPHRFLAVTGQVVSWSEDGWREHMDALSRRYLKVNRYPWSFPGERRAIFRIEATRVYHEAGDAEVASNG